MNKTPSSPADHPDVDAPHTSVKTNAVNHPPHYTEHPSGVECIEITEHMNFNVGNAVKYLWRADLKNGIEDLEKAEWYVQREIRRRKQTQSEVVRRLRRDEAIDWGVLRHR